MKQQIKQAFPRVIENNCLQTVRNSIFYIFDTPERKCELHQNASGIIHFTVENPLGKEITFLAIDQCLFFDSDQSRCDFAVFDAKCFCFVEIKEMNIDARRSEHLRKARKQLLATITYFLERLKFTTRRIEAYTCVGNSSDNSRGPFPATRATGIEVTLDFE